MSILTKAQKIGLEALRTSAQRKIFFSLSKSSLNQPSIAKLRLFYGAKTTRNVIEHAISNAAARLFLKDCDILENAILDKLTIIKKFESADSSDKSPTHRDTVKVKAMIWEIIIIASQAPMSFDDPESLVDFCLRYSSNQMKTLFGDA